jgi:hypothetical protein
MRVVLLLLGMAVTCCAVRVDTIGVPRPEVLRDVESYAIASCFTYQTEPYLKDQGDAWASVIVQRMRGSVDVLADIAELVKGENAKGEIAVIRDDTGPGKDKTLPLLYCSELIDRPSVRAAIKKAVVALNPSYQQGQGARH